MEKKGEKKKKPKKRACKNRSKAKDTASCEVDFTDFSFLGCPRQVNNNICLIKEQDLVNSASIKILHDEFVDPECLFKNTKSEDEKDLQRLIDDKNKTHVSVYLLKQQDCIRPIFLEKSLLNKDQHLQCLHALEIMSSGSVPSTPEARGDIAIFQELESKRFVEYSKFSDFVEKAWKVKNNMRLMNIQPELKKFIHEYCKSQVSRVFSYPQNYKIATMLPLENNQGCDIQTYIKANMQEVVYECGSSKLITLPMVNKRYKILNDYESLIAKVPIEENKHFKSENPVSQDEIAMELAEKYQADVVMSSSSLKCLIDNHPPKYNREWTLPVVVKEYLGETDYRKKKIILIDKPLPSTKYAIHDLNQLAHEISLRAGIYTKTEQLECHSPDLSMDFEDSFGPYSPKSPETSIQMKLENSDANQNSPTSEMDSLILTEQPTLRKRKLSETELETEHSTNVEGNMSLTENLAVVKSSEDEPVSSEYPKESSTCDEITSENGEAASNGKVNSLNMESNINDENKISNEDNSDSDSDMLLIDESFMDNTDIEECDVEMGRVTRSMAKMKSESLSNFPIKHEICSTPQKEARKQPVNSHKELLSSTENDCDIGPSVKLDINAIKNSPTKILQNKTSDPLENKGTALLTVCEPSSTERLTTYAIWKFVEKNDGEESVLKKDQNKEIKILLRTKTDGKLVNNDGLEQQVLLMPKLEYQMEFGAECSSLSECTRQWSSLFFQPTANIARIRLNAMNSEICSYKMHNLQSITSETFRIHKHNPQRDLNRLFRILSIMSTSLLAGTYMLKHNVTMQGGAKLYMAHESSESIQLDLHKIYEEIELEKVSLQQFIWNPIDPFVITDKHRREGILPSMFPWNFKTINSKQRKKGTAAKAKGGKSTDHSKP